MTIDDGASAEAGASWAAAESPDPSSQATTLSAAAPHDTESLAVESPITGHTPWPLGCIAFGIAVLLLIAEGVAVYLASFGQPGAATIIGQVLVVLTALPLALGIVAVLRRRNTAWGIAAMVLAVVANPLILINVLTFFGAT